MTFLTDSKKPT